MLLSPRMLVVRDLATARRFPLVTEPGTPALPRGQEHTCGRCGGQLEEVVVTTLGADPRVWAAWPLAVDGWRCAGCGGVVVPAGLSHAEARALLEAGLLAARAGELDEAELQLRRLLNARPELTVARVNLGSLYEDRLQREVRGEARKDLVQRYAAQMEEHLVAALHGRTHAPPHVYLALGRLYRATGRLEEAEQYLEAFVTATGDTEARQLLANLLYERAFAMLEPSLLVRDREAGPVDPEALDAGAGLLHRVIDLRDDHAQSWWLLGKAHQAQGEPEQALPCFERACELAPTDADLLRELALTLLALGEAARAVTVAKRAVDAAPSDESHLTNLALALLCADQLDPADRTAAKAADRGDATARKLLEVIGDVREGRRPRPTRWPE